MKKALIYTRVSTLEQVREGLSLEVQKEKCVEWAKNNGYQIVGVYADEGKSATTLKGRRALQEALARCQEEKVDAVLVLDTDRLARNPVDHFAIKATLQKAGTRVVSVSQPMLSDGSMEGDFMDTVIAGFNALQSQMTGRKVKKSLEKKVKEGWFPGCARLGYVNVNKGTKDNPHRIIEPDKERRKYLTLLFKLYATGNYSVDYLVDFMYEQGLRSRNDKKVSRSTLYNTLKDPFYIGKMRFKGEIYPGGQEPLTTPEILEACQKVTRAHNRNACRRRKYRWLLSGFVYCHECGTRFYCSWQQKKKKAYYHGSTRNGCKHYVPLGELEDKVAEEFKKIQFSEEFTQKIIKKAKELVKKSRESRGKETQGLRNAVKQLETKRNILENKLLDQVVDNETFKRKHNELNLQIQNLDNEIATIENQRGFDIDVVSEILSLTQNIHDTYLNANFDAKRHYLSIFFEKFEVKDREIVKVVYAPLFKHLLETQSAYRVSSKWLPGKDSNLHSWLNRPEFYL